MTAAKKYGCGKATCEVGCDCDRFIEIWNNVFTRFAETVAVVILNWKRRTSIPSMGLERLAVAVQDVESIFDIDTMKAIREGL